MRRTGGGGFEGARGPPDVTPRGCVSIADAYDATHPKISRRPDRSWRDRGGAECYAAIQILAPRAPEDLSGKKIDAIVGDSNHRDRAITALIR